MFNSLSGQFKKSRNIIILASAVTIIGVGTMFKDLSGQYKNISQIQNGIQICSARVGQTYTASAIGDSSSIYMDSSFTGATEECFGEASSLIENYTALANIVTKRMNSLSSNVHWFHESLRTSGNGFNVKESESANSEIGDKFANFENSTETTMEHIESHVESLNESLSNLKLAFFLSAFVFMCAVIWEMLERRSKKTAMKELEDEAFNELISDDSTAISKVEEIIVSALELHEMEHCSKLLSSYRQKFEEKPKLDKIVAPLMPMTMVTGNEDMTIVEKKMNDIWERADLVEEESTQYIKGIDIEDMSSKVIDHLSNKLIAEGIIVDMSIEPTQVAGEMEGLEQIIYYLALDGLTNTNKSPEEKFFMRGKRLGSIFNLEFISTGDGREVQENTSIEIARELAQDIGGKIEISDTYGLKREITGRKIRLILKTADSVEDVAIQEEVTPVMNKEVIRIERGTKRELLERMNS